MKKITNDVIDVGGCGSAFLISTMFGEVISGQVTLGIMPTMIAYKQKRQEKNLEKLIKHDKDNERTVDKRLLVLEEKVSEARGRFV